MRQYSPYAIPPQVYEPDGLSPEQVQQARQAAGDACVALSAALQFLAAAHLPSPPLHAPAHPTNPAASHLATWPPAHLPTCARTCPPGHLADHVHQGLALGPPDRLQVRHLHLHGGVGAGMAQSGGGGWWWWAVGARLSFQTAAPKPVPGSCNLQLRQPAMTRLPLSGAPFRRAKPWEVDTPVDIAFPCGAAGGVGQDALKFRTRAVLLAQTLVHSCRSWKLPRVAPAAPSPPTATPPPLSAATQHEVCLQDAQHLVQHGCKYLFEGGGGAASCWCLASRLN